MNVRTNTEKCGVAKGSLFGSTLSADFVKEINSNKGYNNLSDDGAKDIAEDASIQVKQIILDSLKFMRHAKRNCLTTRDINSALRVRGLEPHNGLPCKDFIPLSFASNGSHEPSVHEDQYFNFNNISNMWEDTNQEADMSIQSHWLVIDGNQPVIRENPSISKSDQILEATNPVKFLDESINKELADKMGIGKKHKWRNIETAYIKQLATNELSLEQQLYYKKITEACVGSDESRRCDALQSLSEEPALKVVLPQICIFICEGVKFNVVQKNIHLLQNLMRMAEAILNNSSKCLERYLHQLVPSVITCIVSKQLSMRPELDNHWILRDFAARLMVQICKDYSTSTNNLQTRFTRIFTKALFDEKTHLTTLYGSLIGLSVLGDNLVEVTIIPRIKFIAERIAKHLIATSQSKADKTAAGHIGVMLLKCCPPILKQIRNSPDFVDDYKQEFGFLGPPLCQAVVKLRTTNAPLLSTSSLPITSGSITSAAQNATGRPQMTLPPQTNMTMNVPTQQLHIAQEKQQEKQNPVESQLLNKHHPQLQQKYSESSLFRVPSKVIETPLPILTKQKPIICGGIISLHKPLRYSSIQVISPRLNFLPQRSKVKIQKVSIIPISPEYMRNCVFPLIPYEQPTIKGPNVNKLTELVERLPPPELDDLSHLE